MPDEVAMDERTPERRIVEVDGSARAEREQHQTYYSTGSQFLPSFHFFAGITGQQHRPVRPRLRTSNR